MPALVECAVPDRRGLDGVSRGLDAAETGVLLLWRGMVAAETGVLLL
jgi:hypothetical protein